MATPPRPRRVTASTLHALRHCERRLWLDVHEPGEKTPPTEFDLALRARGIEHERAVRASMPGLVGPIFTWAADATIEAAAAETQRLMRETRAPLFQPAFLSADGRLAGVPDFLGYDEDGGMVIGDAKLLTRLEGHPEVNLQMAHYAALIEETTGRPVARCEIVNGRFERIEVPRAPEPVWRAAVARALAVIDAGDEPELLQSHSTCEGCAYYGHCWDRATREHRIEVLPSVTRATLPRLAQLGIHTLDQLVTQDPAALRSKHLSTGVATGMIREARAMVEQRAQWHAPHGLPPDRTPVWFDLEGDPDSDVQVPIYMWGVGVTRPDREFDYRVVISDPGEDGDRDGWMRFLALARDVFAAHPDAVWVHYAEYERTWTRRYLERYGDPEGTAAQVLDAMLDLRAALQRAVVLPLRSYSIKHVARTLAFTWRNPEANSQWSTVTYRRARMTGDPAERERLFGLIAEYNEDDLRAMRQLWEWMVREAPAAGGVTPEPANDPTAPTRSRRSRRRRTAGKAGEI